MSKLLIATWMLAAAPVVFASQSPAPRTDARFGTQRPASNPYKKLFEPQKSLAPSIANQQPAAKPQVVCGMKIIPADPAIDPKMLVKPQADGIDYKLRTVDPPICMPAR